MSANTNHILTFSRVTGQGVIEEKPGVKYYNSQKEWVIEFDTSTVPPTLVNSDTDSIEGVSHLANSFHVTEIPPSVPRLYIDYDGNIVELLTGVVIMKGPGP